MPKKKSISSNNNNDVGEALALLSETLTEEEARIREEGADAMKTGAYDTATEVIDFAKQLLAFQGKVAALADEWEEIENARDAATPEVQEIVSKKFFGKKRKGIITTQDEYCQPLLEVLVEMGGKGPTDEVLDRLGDKMKGVLKPVDYECHKSDEKQIRWRNSAQWARNKMVNTDGRMKKGSPRGIWEISDKGRKWLEKQ
ncbi:MAG: winged helix-turn-helix domain-containing protein [Lentimonas sp.]